MAIIQDFSQLVRTRCFIGTEAEGPHRGKTVLFVPGSVTRGRILAVLAIAPKFDRVYYGAGNDYFSLDYDVMSAISNEVSCPIDMEFTIGSLHYGIEPFRAMMNGGLLIYRRSRSTTGAKTYHYEKSITEGGLITWVSAKDPANEIYKTIVSDPLFDGDTFLEI